MFNQMTTISQVRNPRALVKLNDTVIREIDSIEYVENNYYVSDSFRVKMPLYGRRDALELEYFMSQPAILVELFLGFPNDPVNYGVNDLDSMIVGAMEPVDCDIFGSYIEFAGRDLSSKFIDNKTTEKYPNLTASDIAIILAKKRGLTPVVTATSQPVGYYYTQDYVQLGNAIPEWDLLTYLAQREGFMVFVRGKSLYFQPRPTESSPPTVWHAQPPAAQNGQTVSFYGSSLKISRNMNYARDIIVKVRSMNASTGYTEAIAKGTPNKKTVTAAIAQPIGEAETYEYSIPGLSKEQAQLRAQQILQDISQHERNIEATLPADNKLRKDSAIKIQGVCPSADQIYFPDTITRRMSPTEGYIMEVRGKNHSPQSVVLA